MGRFSERFLPRAIVGRRQETTMAAQPLPANKGQLHGACNRSACLAPGATFFNRGTRKHYCRHCAGIINRANHQPGQPPLCTLDPGVQAEMDEKRLAQALPEAPARVRRRL